MKIFTFTTLLFISIFMMMMGLDFLWKGILIEGKIMTDFMKILNGLFWIILGLSGIAILGWFSIKEKEKNKDANIHTRKERF